MAVLFSRSHRLSIPRSAGAVLKINLTEKQIRVLRFFRDYRMEKGISPTLEEAAADIGVSKITVYEHLNQLIKKGAVQRAKAKARSVTVLYDPDQDSFSPGGGASLPLVGTIAAGRPIEAIDSGIWILEHPGKL